MARRDARRDWGRSLFVWLMIAVPVAAFACSQVILGSQFVSPAELLDLRLGAAHTRLTWVGHSFEPAFDDSRHAVVDDQPGGLVRPLPGWGDSFEEQEGAIAHLTSQSAQPLTLGSALTQSGDSLVVLGIDARRPAGAAMVRLTSGRLPANPGEVLVTAAGTALGLPSSGNVALREGSGQSGSWQVVGTADVGFDQVVYAVGLPDPAAPQRDFLLTGDGVTTWQDAVRLAGEGFETTSRGIAANPPEFAAMGQPAPNIYYGGLFGAGALLEVALLVGPAFAIGADRQRRTLGLMAANGGGVRQLRRAALGQAVLLGASAAIAGTAVGALAGVVAWPTLVAANPLTVHGPLELPLLFLLVILILGVLTAVVAALLPTRGLGKLDVVGALRGSTRHPVQPRRRRTLLVGLGTACTAVGVAVTWLSVQSVAAHSQAEFWEWAVAVVLVVSGVLLLMPDLLVLLARLSGRGSVTWRLALRDLGRHRGRATATFAAILGGSVILGTVWTMVASIDADMERMYQPDLPYGQAEVWAQRATIEHLQEAVAAMNPQLRTILVSRVAGRTAGNTPQDAHQLFALRAGCEPDITEGGDRPECRSLGSDGRAIMVAPIDGLRSLFDLEPDQVAALQAGRMLVNTEPLLDQFGETVTELAEGTVRFAYRDDGTDPATHALNIPATPITAELIDRGSYRSRVGALLTPQAAEQQGLTIQDWSLRIVDPAGPITSDLEQQINTTVGDRDWLLRVERGYQPTPQPMVWAITTTLAALAVLAAAMATILATTELRPFLATLTAVGADYRLSRKLAATQAATLALLGTGIGFTLGITVGAPLALAATDKRPWAPPLLVVPWQVALAFGIGVPLIAVTIAAIATPARPALTKRTA